MIGLLLYTIVGALFARYRFMRSLLRWGRLTAVTGIPSYLLQGVFWPLVIAYLLLLPVVMWALRPIDALAQRKSERDEPRRS